MGERTVITGCGAVTSVAASAAETWSAVVAGATGVGPIEGFDASGFACHLAAQVLGFHTESLGVSPRDARIMGLPGLMLLGSGREAMVQAGLRGATPGPDEIGIFAGMGMVDRAPEDLRAAVAGSRAPTGIDYERFFGDGYREIYPLWPLAMLNNVGFCLAALHLGARGENAVFSPGADAALLAVAEASSAVASGRAAAALAGGASERVTADSLARAHLAGGWGQQAANCALGEGAAVLVLEAESMARARGATPRAVVAGWGFAHAACASDGFVAAMASALERVGPAPRPADTAVLHDERCRGAAGAERDAVASVFGRQAEPTALLSSKEMLGHALAGGAAVDVVLAVHVLDGGFVPRSLIQGGGGPRPPADGTPCGAAVRPRRIVVNAQSWSGAYGCLILDAVE
jgi:3-oxoacyl-[acyl-carrier-protein] synthase II